MGMGGSTLHQKGDLTSKHQWKAKRPIVVLSKLLQM
jgi:hypothetical protein